MYRQILRDSRLCGNDGIGTGMTDVGMTAGSAASETVQKPNIRHSRESGNPVKHTNPQGFSTCNTTVEFLHSLSSRARTLQYHKGGTYVQDVRYADFAGAKIGKVPLPGW